MSEFSEFFESRLKRLERGDKRMTPRQVRKRGLIKAMVGTLVFCVAELAVGAFIAYEASQDPLETSRSNPSFGEYVLKRILAVAVGVPMALGLFAIVFGVQQAAFGRPWTDLPLAARVLFLAVGIPAVFAAMGFAAFSLFELMTGWFPKP
jgi:hypothetical protein